MWTTCGVLLLYNVSLSCIAIVIWVRLIIIDLIEPWFNVICQYNKSSLYSSEEAEESQGGGYKHLYEHKACRSQETMQSLTTIYGNDNKNDHS